MGKEIIPYVAYLNITNNRSHDKMIMEYFSAVGFNRR